ncbi:glutamine-hydrolyzing GMP synthase [Candidatus Roizmanbacteria bacterium]|nr:glutamine-hydrolyzing GMP synthase [Candidatus Roizmanbacteria bacterium]
MILVVDFGSQTCHLISRRLRDLGIENIIVDPENILSEIELHKPKGLIFSGGPASVYEKNAPTITKNVFDLGIPILGICYGWQLTSHLLGGDVKSGKKEYGPANLKINKNNSLLSNIESYSRVWVSHGDTVYSLPRGFVSLAETGDVSFAAAANLSKKIYGIQFHPEIEHTVYGVELLKNFVLKICSLKPKKYELNIKEIISSIKKEVGNGQVIGAVSGGVDSTVAATLIAKAVGKKLHPIYVESGLMRIGTKEEVIKNFKKNFGINPIIVEVKKEFLKRLKGVEDAETKRKIIGKLYIELFEKESKKIKGVTHLMQGTIYSDVIESKGTRKADKIKSHHNVGGLPEKMNLKLIEPLRYFYKDEVRKIGKMLGLPNDVVNKQVFPGPGQAIRIIGEVTFDRLTQQQKADQIVLEEITRANFYKKVYMSFPIMTNTVSTCIKGDARKLLEVIALRIIESKDVMSTDWAKIPYEVLQRISTRIVNEVPRVSRVVYDITTKPPATMEWE